MRFALVSFALLSSLIACGHVTPEQRAAQERCEKPQNYGLVEVHPAGDRPARQFRVLGPVEAKYDTDASGRYRTLQVRACELGGEAVIDMKEFVSSSTSHGMISGGQISMNTSDHVSASGMAVVFVEQTN